MTTRRFRLLPLLLLLLLTGCPDSSNREHATDDPVHDEETLPPDARTAAILKSIALALHTYHGDTGTYPCYASSLKERKTPPGPEQETALVRALLASPKKGGGENAPYIHPEPALGRRAEDGTIQTLKEPPEFKAGEKILFLDPWGNPIHYREWQSRSTEIQGPAHQPNSFDLWSNGPDGESGTEDDITNW